MKNLTKEQIDVVVAGIVEISELIVRETGDHDPMTIYYAEDGAHVLSMAPIMDEAEKRFAAGDIKGGYKVKDQMIAAMRQTAEDKKAFGAVTVIEAWAKKVQMKDVQIMNGDQPGMGGIVAELPRFSKDREEVLIISYEFKMGDGSKLVGGVSRKIVRDNGKASLGPPEAMSGTPDGRMAGIIK